MKKHHQTSKGAKLDKEKNSAEIKTFKRKVIIELTKLN